MKLGRMKDGTRDGKLVVVSRDLRYAAFGRCGHATLRGALENRDAAAAPLVAKYEALNAGSEVSAFAFRPDRSVGSATIAERRVIELIEHGEMRTPYMRFEDRVRMEMRDASGRSIFGAIDQRMVRAG